MAEKFIKLKQEHFKILDMGLNTTDMVVLAVIDGLSQQRGYCSSTNQSIAEMCHLNKRTVIRALNNLEDFDIIRRDVNNEKGNKRDMLITLKTT